MASIPPLRFRKVFRGNIKFTLPPSGNEPDSAKQERYLKPEVLIMSGQRDKVTLVLEEGLTPEEKEIGLFHFMEFQTGKKSSKTQTYYCIHCLDHRLEVQGVQLQLIPDAEPTNPKCQSDTPCRAMFERRRDGKITQLHCASNTEVVRRMAFGLQLKGFIKKAWKPSLVPSERAVATRHIMDFELEVCKSKDEPKSNMSFLAVPM